MEARREMQQSSEATPRRRYVRLQIGITLVVVAVVFCGLEISARVRATRKFGAQSLHSIALRDRFTAWRNNPAYGRVDRHINAQGFRRGREISLEKPANTVRIFLTGGSVAYGWTTGWPEIDSGHEFLYDNQTISHYLEQNLNEAYPSKHWEVINAAVVGYQLNLELAQTQTVLLRYHPDGIIYLDGNNDLFSLLRSTAANYDPYVATPTAGEFELLANPGSLRSLLFFASVWTREHSAFFRSTVDRMQSNEKPPARPAADAPKLVDKVRRFDLNPEEQARFDSARGQIPFYPRVARQIKAILAVDGVQPVFLLQPELFLTRKPLTDTERRLLNFQRNNPALLLYSLQEIYPEIGAQMAETSRQDHFAFENLIDVFDHMPGQAFTDDCHLTAEANRLVAERVSPIIGRMFAGRETPLQ